MKFFNFLFINLCVLMASVSVNAQTTINLADQCNCEVLKSTTELTAGATTPTGADTGDLLVDPSGDIFYWDGNSWEPASSLSGGSGGAAIEPWFGTDDNAAATSNTENIYQLGDVGIGTATPERQLHVNGRTIIGATDLATPNNTPNDLLVTDTDNSGRAVISAMKDAGKIAVIESFGDLNRLNLYSGASAYSTLVSSDISNAGWQLGNNQTNEVLNATVNATRASISSDFGGGPNVGVLFKAGNVGISSTLNMTPASKLHVDGAITTAGGFYPDYVFEAYEEGVSEINKDYAFKTLEEVETFIKINKHLPGVTGIKELTRTEDGKYNFNITATSVQTLEKVEELFLYTIEQDKKIKTLEKKVADLEDLKAEMAQIKAMILKNQK